MSWPRYVFLLGTTLASMFAGSQVVHMYYQPLGDLKELALKRVEELKLERQKELQEQAKNEQVPSSN